MHELTQHTDDSEGSHTANLCESEGKPSLLPLRNVERHFTTLTRRVLGRVNTFATQCHNEQIGPINFLECHVIVFGPVSRW